MNIKRYYPAFCEGFPEEEASFDDLAGLLEISFVKSWREEAGFYRYSRGGNNLMAEMDGGERWYVVGNIKGGKVAGLPEFDAESRLRERREKNNT